MFAPFDYELIDFGEGRKLERFGSRVIDRPSPSAGHGSIMHPEQWHVAEAVFQRTGPSSQSSTAAWIASPDAVDPWTAACGVLTFELRLTPFGHIGLFAEQWVNWEWVAWQVARAAKPFRVLNLFGYTGGSTLAAAAAGAEVTHVDAARNVVAWARRNAHLSGLHQAPIRWITEDASRFVQREIRRGNQYQAIVLDPPTYGHGPKGEPWKIHQDLPRLLAACAKLLSGPQQFVLLTSHSEGFGPPELEATLADVAGGSCQAGVIAKSMNLQTSSGRRLPAGVVARWVKES